MNSFTSFFKQIPGALIALFSILVIELTLASLPSIKFITPAGVFFTIEKREVAETHGNDFDVILFGDSRSLSLNGKKKENGSEFSLYNFSLPAAGPRYVKYFLQKYLENNKKPKLILYALDPEQFRSPTQSAFLVDPKIWQIFKHRILYLFSITENIVQYEGKEKWFVFKESLPYLVPSVRYREGLDSLLTQAKGKELLQGNLPNTKKNKEIASIIQSSNGQINLGSYLNLPPFITKKDIEITHQNTLKGLNEYNPKEKVPVYLEELKGFLEYANEQGIPVAILDIPHAEGMSESKYYSAYKKEINDSFGKDLFSGKILKISEKDYPLEFFAEGIHYNKLGEEKLNQDFDANALPVILKLLQKK